MALNQMGGTQVQALNTQGIDINKDHVEVNIDWIDPSTNLDYDPTDAALVVTHNGNPYTLTKVLQPLSRVDETVGIWHHCFLAKEMTAGTYQFTYSSTAPSGQTVNHVLGWTAAEIEVEQYFIGSLRTKLGDKRTKRYLIDDNTVPLWKDGELYECLEDARKTIGQTPPMIQDIPWNQAYAEAHDQILTGGFICALASRGVFETMNKFQYSDELSLNIDRSGLLQNALSLKAAWEKSIITWKRDAAFHATRSIGMQSGRYPLYYTRVLSLLPNMQNVFYG